MFSLSGISNLSGYIDFSLSPHLKFFYKAIFNTPINMLQSIKFYIIVIQSLGFSNAAGFLVRRKLKINKVTKLSGIAHPIHMRPGSSDGKVFLQIFVDKDYEFNLGFEPEIIIDGGANIGLTSIYLKNKYPNAKIIAVEPDAENLEVLQTNLGKYSNVFVKHAGLWSKKARGKIYDKYGVGKWGLVVEEFDGEAGQKNLMLTDTLTIPDIMDEFGLDRIDLLKLDIETAEKEVFGGNYMTWLPKTKAIIIELHDSVAKGCSKPFFLAINNAFSNYSYYPLGENTVIINNDLVKA